MSFFDRFRRKKEEPTPAAPVVLEQPKEIIKPEKEKPFLITSENEKLDQILTELKALYVLLSQHDQHLSRVNDNVIDHVSELMIRKKEIPETKKLEVEAILKESKTRAEAIEKLRTLGISQASAYRYTDFLKAENEKKEIIIAEN